jgi:cathepsin C
MMAGRRKSGFVLVDEAAESFNSFLETERIYSVDVTDLPKSFDWHDSLKGPRSQGDCGSCYIFATLAMLQARLKIHYEEDVVLSVQHSINCNFYNQGCDGGYPFLVEKYANEYGLVDDKCSSYKASNGHCGDVCDISELEKIYHVKDYRFIGGSYGKSNEREMMLELQKNGPIVVSFEPSYDFMYYQSGIYHSVNAAEWILKGEDKPEWEKVDHSVLCYGWGEEDGEKFWMLQNTWGSDWGESGFFRMRRGTDESHIESLAEAADPIIKTNNYIFKEKKSKVFLDY